ncbi:MAG: hypothetical protein KAT25_00435 [Sulfuriflexus sp.]|nr:hypothetical protein [Sulfuriflexus sp.]
MEDYFNYLGGMVGTITIVPFLFVAAVAGPWIIFYQLHNDKLQWLSRLRWPLAVLTFFSCLFLFISTGGYIGSKFDYASLGMGAGLVSFYYAYDYFTSLLPSTCSIDNK